MIDEKLNHRLSPMDAFFLYVETDEMPMHIGAVEIFEGEIDYERFKATIDSRLHQIPRYLQRVVPAPFNLGHPTWEFDPDFNIDNHIFQLDIDEPGTDEDLRDLASKLFEGPLDRDKPLWEIYIINGMSEGRSALFARVHHCMVDGIAGVGLLYIILDTLPDPPPTEKKDFERKPLPSANARLFDAIWDNAIEGIDNVTKLQKDLVEYGDGAPDLVSSAKEFSSVMGNFLKPIKRLPFNQPFSGERRIGWAQFSFAEARAIRSALGGTVNDVALTVLGGAVRKYMKRHGAPTRREYLRVLVPVNIRKDQDRGALGNHIAFLPAEVPLDVADHVERFRQIHETMDILKKERVADAIHLMFSVLQSSIAPLQASLLSTAAKPLTQGLLAKVAKIPPLHLICTNVPGPQIPLYCSGHKMLEHYALIPVAFEMGVTCGVTTYNQRMFITLIADEQACPDVDALMEYFDECFYELREQAKVRPQEYVHIDRELRARRHSKQDNGASGNGVAAKQPAAPEPAEADTAETP
jgi:diacylglycerol O-acyltransferase / wax synthase